MCEFSKLRGRIYEKYGTMTRFAEALGTSVAYVSSKLQGGEGYSQKTMYKWATLLEIPLEEYTNYFFTNQVKSDLTQA